MKKLSVVAFNGSPHKDGNTSILIRHILTELEREDIHTECIQIGGLLIRGCSDCRKCFENKDMQCVFRDDCVNECIHKIVNADGIILGSPVYFLDITPEMKALIDRADLVARANNGPFRRKVGAAVTAVRRSGATHTIDTMLHFMLYSGMILTGSPVIGIGLNKGDVLADHEGIARAKEAGQNMAWLLKTITSTEQTEDNL